MKGFYPYVSGDVKPVEKLGKLPENGVAITGIL